MYAILLNSWGGSALVGELYGVRVEVARGVAAKGSMHVRCALLPSRAYGVVPLRVSLPTAKVVVKRLVAKTRVCKDV